LATNLVLSHTIYPTIYHTISH